MPYGVIYRSYIKKDKEADYQVYWNQIATFFVKEKGALGSTLHKTEKDLWVAYSRWPDKKTKEANWSKDSKLDTFPEYIQKAIKGLKNCLDLTKEEFPEIGMEIIEEISQS